MEWTTSLKHAINYIEAHLLTNIGAEDVADAVHMSAFYFQKGFRIMSGYTIGEYIRYRRLYLAALDIIGSDTKIIDLAYKYGYETPESFTKAFQRFHGVSPMKLSGDASKIRTFLPLKISIEIKGGYDMDYVIEKMNAMKMIGFERTFSYDEAYHEIPKFWDEFYAKNCHNTNHSKSEEDVFRVAKACRIGEFGICIDDLPGQNAFRYMIAGIYDGGIVPEGMKVYDIPALEWTKFRCVGTMPGALQSINTKIYKEWLPGNKEYEIAENIDVEWYSDGDITADNYESAIWIPVKRKS